MLDSRKTQARVVAEYQRVIDDLTMQLELANLENERLVEEVKAQEQGRTEQDENHEGILVEYLEQIQRLIDEKRELEKKVGNLQEIVSKHESECLPSLQELHVS